MNENVNTKLLSELPALGVSADYLAHVKKINDVFYDQVKLCDQKAAYIFTFMLALLLTSDQGRAAFSSVSYLQSPLLKNILCALFAGSAIFSVMAAILVVLPRNIGKSSSLFWGRWNEQRAFLVDAARSSDAAYLFDQYLNNADVLADIAKGKYRCVVFAFRALLVTVVSFVLMSLSA